MFNSDIPTLQPILYEFETGKPTKFKYLSRIVSNLNILRKTIEGYLDSVSSLTFNTIKTLLVMHVFHSSRHLQSKWMLYFSHASMV